MVHLVIFDIDGTLLNAKGAGRRALERAFAQRFGVLDAFRDLSFAGATDSSLIQQAASRSGKTLSNEDWLSLKHQFLSYLKEELDKNPGTVMPGLPDLLFVLQSEGFFLALATGNFKATGYQKLAPFGLAGFFPVGGFAESGINRDQVVAEAIKQSLAHYRIHPDRITLIGDTPQDVAAAYTNGIRSIAVATGPFSLQELEQHHPDVVISDLSSVERVLGALQS
ncbi:MAG: hypothetical protein C7B46_16210 [Sulfobacillus benefaciens]|uniref:Haloacid dehalogenase n=1 Tax=Sulfobacillus benefaciens TaxID=453960 RepID=A0A2T2XC39_9FIRM|nr:MAG: hypothetical protein C7B46_16210 [Sulfobacillus benefaciens]